MISILMPVYNGAPYLRESIGSVTAQTSKDWEMIVLDDGSTDNSWEVLQELAKEEPRIRLFQKANDPDGNVARNIRWMCGKAQGDYAFYMSQDDTIAPDCLERLSRRAAETGADIVLPDMLLRFADGHTGEWPCSYPPDGNYDRIMTPREAFYEAVDFHLHGFGLVRMALMADERNDTSYYDSDEYNSRMQFLWARNGIAFAPTTFYYYQGNPDAITHRFHVRRFQRLKTHILLAQSFEQEFTDSHRRLRLKMQLIRTYITMTHLYFTHCQEMTDEEKTKARQCFREFERHISFNGFRRAVWQRLNNYERAFATAYFLLGSALPLQGIYRLLHSPHR